MTEITAPVSGTEQAEAPAAKRSRTGRVLCLFGLVGSALALSASWLSLYSLFFDFLSHFTLHYVLVAAACLIGFFMPRARVLTALLIIATGIAAIAWWPQFVSRNPAPPAGLQQGERQLRLMTFNTWLQNKDWQAVTAEIRRHDPDIVTLIEFGEEKRKTFDALKKEYPYSVHCIEKIYCHMAIISKYPLYDVGTRHIWLGTDYIKARLGKDFGRTYIYGLHSTRPPFVRSQIVQLRAMAKRLRGVPGQKIVMGDFNSTPYARLLSQFAAHNALERITYLPTWPSRWGPFPQLAIDHVFLSSDMRALNKAWIGQPAGSDHYPIIVDVAIKVSP